MLRKGTLWLADWRDQHGNRKRKGFKSKRQAQAFANKMRRQALEKKAHRSAPSAR